MLFDFLDVVVVEYDENFESCYYSIDMDYFHLFLKKKMRKYINK